MLYHDNAEFFECHRTSVDFVSSNRNSEILYSPVEIKNTFMCFNLTGSFFVLLPDNKSCFLSGEFVFHNRNIDGIQIVDLMRNNSSWPSLTQENVWRQHVFHDLQYSWFSWGNTVHHYHWNSHNFWLWIFQHHF